MLGPRISFETKHLTGVATGNGNESAFGYLHCPDRDRPQRRPHRGRFDLREPG
jgi:hypothetical protein